MRQQPERIRPSIPTDSNAGQGCPCDSLLPMAGAQQEALFRVSDAHLLANIAAFGVGASGAFGVGPTASAAGMTVNLPGGRSEPPHYVLVQADDKSFRLFASDKRGVKGPQFLEAGRGTFRAALHRLIGQVQLILFVPDRPPIELRGKWGPFRRGPIRIARTVMSLSKSS